jgi:hypothetical protein
MRNSSLKRLLVGGLALCAVIGTASLASAQPQGIRPGGCVVPIPPSKTGWVPKHLWKPFKRAVATRAAAAMGLMDRQGRPDPSKVQVYTSRWSRGMSKNLFANGAGQYRGGHIIQAAHKASKSGHNYKVKGAYYAYQSSQGHVEVFPIALTGTPEGATKGKHVQKVDAKQPYHGTYAYAEHSMPAQKTVQLVKARNTALAVTHRQPGQEGANILASAFNPAKRMTTYVVHGQPTHSNEARDPKATATVSLFKNRFIMQHRGILPGGCVINPSGDSTVRTKFLDQARPVICPIPPGVPTPMPPYRPAPVLPANQ